MRIACVSYRDWALRIYDALAETTSHTFLVIRSKDQYDEDAIIDFSPDIALYYGWSWKVSSRITESITSVMLHPSPLPRYRGGSPIQNQIINGETQTAVTLFVMNDRMDAGDIVGQKQISLNGHLKEILARITEAGIELTLNILQAGMNPVSQDESQASICKRRMPSDSEITLDELKSVSGQYLYDKVRMLEDPYPNAFIRTSDGRRLLIKRAELE